MLENSNCNGQRLRIYRLVLFHMFIYFFFLTTVDSRYLEVEGTRWNTSRYPYFDISDVQNWGKYQTNNQNFTN